MIDRFLRRLTVGRRMVGGFLVIVGLFAVTILTATISYNLLANRLRQVTNVDAKADRLVLLAWVRIESSRLNLLRYNQDYIPSVQESLNDVAAAVQNLTEAQELITDPTQKASIAAIIRTLGEYHTIVSDVQTMRQKGQLQKATLLTYTASKTGIEIGQRIEQIVTASEANILAVNRTATAEAQTRLFYLTAANIVILALTLGLVTFTARSITQPLTELRSGAETFRTGRLDTRLTVTGTDELSLLAQTFNQMAAQLSQSYTELEQRVAERTRELVRRSSYLEASAEVARAAASILETDKLIRQVVGLIRERFALYYVGLFLLDETGEWSVLQADMGEQGPVLPVGFQLKASEGMLGWSIAHSRSRVVARARQDLAELPKTQSEVTVPLRSRGRVLGAFSIQSEQPDAFDQDFCAVLQTMADQVGTALDNARLFAESQAALEAERRAYGEISRQAWAQMSHARAEWGYRCDPRGISPIASDWAPEMQQAYQEQRLALTGQEAIALPVQVRDQVVGTLRFCKENTTNGWTQEEIEVLKILAEQLGVALESARLYQDTQRRAAQEKLVGEITARMRESLDMETILHTAVTEIGQALKLAALDVRLGMGTNKTLKGRSQ